MARLTILPSCSVQPKLLEWVVSGGHQLAERIFHLRWCGRTRRSQVDVDQPAQVLQQGALDHVTTLEAHQNLALTVGGTPNDQDLKRPRKHQSLVPLYCSASWARLAPSPTLS